MTPFTTARDVSLSIWQSAVNAAAAGSAHGLAEGAREDEPATATATGTLTERSGAPAGGAAGRETASPKTDGMNLATAAYVAAADPHDPSPKAEALRASGFAAAVPSGATVPIDAGVATSAAADTTLQSEIELSALHHELAEAMAENNTVRQRLVEKRIAEHPAISVFDWMKPVIEYLKYYRKLKGEPQYRSWKIEGANDPDYSLIEWKLPAKARVAIIADWGTGREEAINVLKAACSLHPNAIIHLGDIYYSGLPEECRDNFFQIVRTYAVDVNNAPIPVFTLAGNHDYYSGGGGYLGLIDMLNSSNRKQDASYFCLRSADDGWQFLAADTGYNDHTLSIAGGLNATGPYLRDDEIEWHHHKLNDTRFSGRTILLTHHQAFSANERIGDPDGHDRDSINQRLLNAFAPYLGSIPLWLWGHEHSLMIYEPFMNVKRGRCIGHGAVPVSSGKDPYSNPKFENVRFKEGARLGTRGRWYNHGFAFITLRGKDAPLIADYYQVIDEDTPAGYSMVSLFREDDVA